MGRPSALKTEGFEEIKQRLFDVTGCSNASQLAAYMGMLSPSVTRPLKNLRIPDSWFPVIARKANTAESYLRHGFSPSEVDLNFLKSHNTATKKHSNSGGDVMDSRIKCLVDLLVVAKEKNEALEREIFFLKESAEANTKAADEAS